MKSHNSDLGRRSPGGGRVLCREYVPSRHIRSSGCALSPWLVNSASLMCDMNWWPSGRDSASAYCGCWFDLRWWLWCALLMRPNKVETAVQCSVCRTLVFARFSSHDNSNILIVSLHTVKCYQVLPCITNNLIRQSFGYTKLNDQTVLFQTIQFSFSHLSGHREDLEVMVMKGYFTFPKTLAL